MSPLSLLSAELLHDLTGTVTQSDEPLFSRRKEPRIPVNLLGSAAPTEASTAIPALVVTIHNISAGGVAISGSRPFITGETFLLALPRRCGGTVQLLCTVRRCESRRAGSIFYTGATLDEIISISEATVETTIASAHRAA